MLAAEERRLLLPSLPLLCVELVGRKLYEKLSVSDVSRRNIYLLPSFIVPYLTFIPFYFYYFIIIKLFSY